MKKKGLIISTIVMAIVLIASLTTATYAWFSTSANTKVDQIAVTIDAASDIDLGVTASANYGNTNSNVYKFGNTTFTPSGNSYTVATGTTGLGSSLKLGNFAITTAVATTNAVAADQAALRALNYDDDVNSSSFDPTKTIFAANIVDGATDSEVGKAKMSSATIAAANSEYINLVLGARANKPNEVYGIVAKITVKTTGDADTLLMDAALHLYFATGVSAGAPTHAKDVDVFGGSYGSEPVNYMGKDTPKDQVGTSYALTGVTYSVEDGQAVATIYVLVGGAMNTSGSALTTTAIYPLQVYGYIWGPDADCMTNATGCSCTIDMEFIAVNTANLAGSLSGVTPLSLNALGA